MQICRLFVDCINIVKKMFLSKRSMIRCMLKGLEVFSLDRGFIEAAHKISDNEKQKYDKVIVLRGKEQ